MEKDEVKEMDEVEGGLLMGDPNSAEAHHQRFGPELGPFMYGGRKLFSPTLLTIVEGVLFFSINTYNYYTLCKSHGEVSML